MHKLDIIEAPNLPALLTIIIVAGTLFATFSELTSRSRTTSDLIFGAVFCYFLIAVSWGLFYEQLYNWHPSSFDLGKDEEVASVFLYFSLVTLTTLGYGDITPVSPICRLAAAVEAATGTLYIAVFVGRLVGRFDPRVRTN